MTQERRSPWKSLLMGLALSVAGVAWMLLMPDSRFRGTTPLALAQASLIFGGILGMVFALALENGATRDEQDAAIRRMVRYILLWSMSCTFLYLIKAPFAPSISLFVAGSLEPRLRRIFVWLGK